MKEPVLIPLPEGSVPLEEIADRSISFEVYEQLALNGDQRDALVPKLTNEALVSLVRDKILPNIVPWLHSRVPVTYDEALALLYAPELVRRLEGR